MVGTVALFEQHTFLNRRHTRHVRWYGVLHLGEREFFDGKRYLQYRYREGVASCHTGNVLVPMVGKVIQVQTTYIHFRRNRLAGIGFN